MCRKYGQEEESSYHIIYQCPAVAKQNGGPRLCMVRAYGYQEDLCMKAPALQSRHSERA
jgi:hypothetical protein